MACIIQPNMVYFKVQCPTIIRTIGKIKKTIMEDFPPTSFFIEKRKACESASTEDGILEISFPPLYTSIRPFARLLVPRVAIRAGIKFCLYKTYVINTDISP